MKKMSKEQQALVKSVIDDFNQRAFARKPFETQWQMNMNFYLGNQFCNIGYGGNLEDQDKQFYWEERQIFNHIAPLVEIRLAKLAQIKPKATVLPASNDEKDVYAAKVSKKILDSISSKLNLSQKIGEAMQWSEVCGTAFYKVVWNSSLGQVVALEDGQPIRSGEVEVSVCSPFEIYPDSFTNSDIEQCQSIIHARAVSTSQIKSIYGLDVDGSDLNVFSLSSTSIGFGGLGYSSSAPKICQGVKKDSALVIEKYEKPSKEHKNGRLTIVVGDQLFFDGDLPYAVGKDGIRDFPFIRQTSLTQIGSFWGGSIVDRLVPVQRAYNAIKNRKIEFMNRLTMGVLKVEDGSIDVENLEDEGLCPGRILVYRQGANSPEFLEGENLSSDFEKEEAFLLEEFRNISGVTELLDTEVSSANLSGVTYQLMIEQDELRLRTSADELKNALKCISQFILRLYKQFALLPRLARIVGDRGEVEMFYFNSSDISSDDIELETENELGESIASKRQMVFDLLNAGLLQDEDGKLTTRMKVKVLELLGLGIWENAQDLNELHIKKADNENLTLLAGETAKVLEIDNHALHIDRHIAFMLSGDYEEKSLVDCTLEEKFLSHIKEKKKHLKENTNE